MARVAGRNSGDRVLPVAIRAFAARGVAGVSLRELAREIGISAPTLLHHAGSKEQLYARVLDEIAAHLSASLLGGDFDERLERFVDWARNNRDLARILMRELIDAGDGGVDPGQWPLAPLIARLAAQVRRDRGVGATEAAMIVFTTFGAATYFAIAEPSIRRIIDAGPRTDLAGQLLTALRHPRRKR